MQTQTKRITAFVTLALAAAGGNALAAGTVTGVSVTKNTIKLGESLNANVAGTIQLDALKKGCALRITLKYADNSTEVTHHGTPTDSFPQKDMHLKPAKAGKVTVIADGGKSTVVQWPPCAGVAQTVINVEAPPTAVIVNPGMLQIKPPAQNVPAGTFVGQAAPIGNLALPTLKSIKQAPYTDQGGETWIEASGTGHCTFTVSGPVTASFSTTAAKPFPIKVKMPNAPTGSHLWTAKGSGGCSGQATTTFKVEP